MPRSIQPVGVDHSRKQWRAGFFEPFVPLAWQPDADAVTATANMGVIIELAA